MAMQRWVLALCAFFVLAVGLSACGSGVPGDAVADVDGTPITKKDFDHWLAIAAKSSAQQSQAPAVVPDPPDYKNCIATLRKTVPKPAKGRPKVTDASLKTSCSGQYGQLKEQTMNFLIQAQWVQKEADEQKVTVSDAEVQKQFNQQKKQSFPTAKGFQSFLRSSGMTLADILFRVKIDTLSTKITDKVNKQAPKVNDAAVTRYYTTHPRQFTQPEQRDIRIVLTRTRAKAEQAKKALGAGGAAKFATVVKKFSVDQQSKKKGGLLPGVVRGDQDRGLDQAAFTAPKDKVLGPVKGSFGFYVFEVTKIVPGKKQPLNATTRGTIRQQLIAQGQQKVFKTFVTSFKKKWTAKTDCRKAFEISSCKNAPKKPAGTTTGGTSGAPAPSSGGGATPQPQPTPQPGG